MGELLEVTGDLFAGTDDAVGHGCNTDGVMGSGIAKTVRGLWPEMYTEYRRQCLHGQFPPGGFWAYKADASEDQPGRIVYNLATQDRPGRHARLEWVESSMRHALVDAAGRGVESFGIPLIGCGIGGLGWGHVRPVLIALVANYPIDLTVYELGR